MTSSLSGLIELVTILIGVVLVLKRVVEMERYHKLRVVVFTSVLSCIVIYFFLLTVYVFLMGGPIQSDCNCSY